MFPCLSGISLASLGYLCCPWHLRAELRDANRTVQGTTRLISGLTVTNMWLARRFSDLRQQVQQLQGTVRRLRRDLDGVNTGVPDQGINDASVEVPYPQEINVMARDLLRLVIILVFFIMVYPYDSISFDSVFTQTV